MKSLLVAGMLVSGLAAALVAVGQEVVEDPFAPRFDLAEARALVDRGKYEDAVKLTAEAREVGWRSAGWQRVRIDALMATGAYEAAAEAAITLATDYGRDLPTLVYVRDVLVRVGETETAENVLEFINRFASAVGTGDEDFDSAEIVALGKAALNMGAEAKFVLTQFFGTARKRSPKLAEAHLEAAELALEKYDYDLAAQYLGEGIEFCGDGADFRYGLARAFAPSDSEVANLHIGKALELNPLHFPTLLLVAGEKLDGDEFDAANEVIERVLASDANHPEALALKSVVAFLENDFDAHAESRERALSYWKDNPRVDHLIGEKLSRKRRFEEARLFQKEALRMDPDFQPAKLALAMDELRLGDEPAAWKLAEEVHAADGYNLLAFNLVTLKDHLKNYATRETDNFVVRMVPLEMEIYGSRAIEILEEARRVLGSKYGLESDGKTLVEFFPEQQDFAIRTFGVPGGQGILGACFGSVVTMNSPGGNGAMSSNWESTLWHEYCHVVTLTATKNKMPRWLSEGISVYEEEVRDGRWGMRMDGQWRRRILERPEEAGGGVVGLGEMGRLFSHPDSAEDVMYGYFLSSLAIKYVVGEYGEGVMRELLADLAEGVNLEDSLGKRTVEMDELESGFEAYVIGEARKLAPEADWEVPDETHPGWRDGAALAAYLESNPNSLWALARRAAALLRDGDAEGAKAPARRLIEIYPEDSAMDSGYVFLAKAHHELGEIEEEVEVLNRLASLSGDAEFAYQRLMELHLDGERWEEARKAASDQMAVNPMMLSPHQCFGISCQGTGQHREAVTAFERVLKLRALDSSEVHFSLAKSHEQLGDDGKARRHVLEALERSPRFREGQQMLMRLIGERNRGPGAKPGEPK